MMNKKSFLILLISFFWIHGFSAEIVKLKGSLINYSADSLFLYRVTNEFYNNCELVKAIPVVDGKFDFYSESISKGLYCLSIQNIEKGDELKDYVNLFLEPTEINVTISKGKSGRMLIDTKGSRTDDKYRIFVNNKYQVENRSVLDSLDNLFYQARDKKDKKEMRRIKDVSTPYYEKGVEQFRNLLNQSIDKYKGSYFGLYLYYTYYFQNHTFSTRKEISEIREYIDSFDKESKKSSYFLYINNVLNKLDRCAVGAQAPLFQGKNLKGKILSLTQFRGKYVLIDFWSSGCHWCRLETPNLLKTFNAFKNKKFTILGVSSDYNPSSWEKAIMEDKSFWNQIILAKNDIRKVMDEYCIVGIPHIILVNPKGVIVAKELRGEDIYKTVSKIINQKN